MYKQCQASGNLDIESEHSADFDKWEPVGFDTNMFSDELWKPGHKEVVYLHVKNTRSIALKYIPNVNVASKTGSVPHKQYTR